MGIFASTLTLIFPFHSQTLHLCPSQIGQMISAGRGAGKVTVIAFFVVMLLPPQIFQPLLQYLHLV